MRSTQPRRSSNVRVEVCVHPWPDKIDRYWVYWETENAYGSRGQGLSEKAAYGLADRIVESGDPSVA